MYIANKERYETMKYNRCGKSGLLLPAFSLGLWHNFGSNDSYDNMVDLLTTAFDLGITHFDLANNYGPYHFPEKLIPLMIANALNDKPLPVYGKVPV